MTNNKHFEMIFFKDDKLVRHKVYPNETYDLYELFNHIVGDNDKLIVNIDKVEQC